MWIQTQQSEVKEAGEENRPQAIGREAGREGGEGGRQGGREGNE